jgi:ABC-type spermidine/putrescine transport system permease subunit I
MSRFIGSGYDIETDNMLILVLVVMPEWKNKIFRAVAWVLGFHKENVWVVTTNEEAPTGEVK